MLSKTKSVLFLVALMVVMPTLLFVGCEEESEDGDPTTISFSDLPVEEQVGYAEDVTDMAVDNTMSVRQMATSMLNGEIAGVGDIFSGALKTGNQFMKGGLEVASPPDTFWTGPDADGWYSYALDDTLEGVIFNISYAVRWTPDIWDDEVSVTEVNSVEVMYSMSTSGSTNGSYGVDISMSQTFNEARTHVSGSMSLEMTLDGFEEFTGGTTYTSTWTDVAIAENDYSGDYTSSMVADFMGLDPETEQVIHAAIAFSNDFSFATDGSGTGTTTVGEVEAIRYFFDAIDAGMWEGYYQIVTEDFEVDHPFVYYL